jgi:hypothetical protein
MGRAPPQGQQIEQNYIYVKEKFYLETRRKPTIFLRKMDKNDCTSLRCENEKIAGMPEGL